MTKPIRWGILGLGNIAHKFALDLAQVTDAELVAVGSRSLEKASEFANQYSVPNYFGSYSELVRWPDIDVIYIATPHVFHMKNTMECLDAGKAVLCEKPFAINQAQTQKMIWLSKEKNLFLMDAIWTQFFPFMDKTREILNSEVLGKIICMEADFGFQKSFDPTSRLHDPNLGGGALLDIGIYPIFLAHSLFGNPAKILSTSCFHQNGIDLTTSVSLQYTDGLIVNTFSTIVSETECEAKIYGEKGYLLISGRWHESQKITLNIPGDMQVFDFPRNHLGYAYEIVEVHKMLRQRKIEHPLLSHQFTLNLMQTLDTVRSQIGLKYPGE